MTKREKIIKGLQYLRGSKETMELISDAIELLKKQTQVKPEVDIDTYYCPACGHRLEHQELLGNNVLLEEFYAYCPGCGSEVIYDDQTHENKTHQADHPVP